MKKRITFKVFACYYCKSLFILQVKNYNDHYDATDYKLNVLSFHNCLKRLKVKSALNPYPNETQQNKDFIPRLSAAEPWLLQLACLSTGKTLNPRVLQFILHWSANVCDCQKALRCRKKCLYERVNEPCCMKHFE